MGPGWEEVAILRGAFNRGQAVSQPRLDELCGRWIEWADPKGQETESLVLVDGLGRRLEPVRQAPRWLCHLLALRHRAVHVLMSWDSPKLGRVFVCQVRSWTKRDYPGFIDISVGGHVVGLADPRQSALAEMQEEMGVGPSDLVAGELTLVGGYDCTPQADDRAFYDAEWRRRVHGPDCLIGMSRLHGWGGGGRLPVPGERGRAVAEPEADPGGQRPSPVTARMSGVPRWPLTAAGRHSVGTSPEAATAVLKRAESLVCEAVRAQVRGGRVLLVTHGDVASMLLCVAAGRDLRCHHPAYGLRTGGLTMVG